MKLIDPWIAKRNPERSQGSHAEPRLQRPWLWSAGHSAYDVASLWYSQGLFRALLCYWE